MTNKHNLPPLVDNVQASAAKTIPYEEEPITRNYKQNLIKSNQFINRKGSNLSSKPLSSRKPLKGRGNLICSPLNPDVFSRINHFKKTKSKQFTEE